MITTKYSMISEVPSEDIAAPGIIRAPRGANPVNAAAAGTRETAPLEASASPRVLHPALNSAPWSSSYAQPRSEPKMGRRKATRNSRKRAKKEGRA